jgi:cathepsin B
MAPRAALVAALATSVEAGTISLSIEDCGSGVPGHVQDINPKSINTGSTSTITGAGTLDSDVAGGSFTLDIKALGVSLQKCNGDICSASSCDLPLGTGSIAFKGLACPVKAGAVEIPMDVTVSSSIPSQLAVLEIDLNVPGALCAKINTKSATSFKDIAEHVNSLKTTWTAQEPGKFDSVEDVVPYLGAFLPGDEQYDEPEVRDFPAINTEIPTSFDAREQWPSCTGMAEVKDQSACGSCWAFGSADSFQDRACVATGKDVRYSADDTAFCSNAGMGCNGGNSAWNWFVSSGVVTGGLYQDTSFCRPYSFAPCAHHVPATSKYPACPSGEYQGTCSRSCISEYGGSYSSDKLHASSAYSVRGVQNIQNELMTKGPLYVAFTVYSDFPTYKSGVYRRTSSSVLGGHAVEVMGWGEESGTPYWLVKNSWNEQWGDGGFFKILRGSNECGIESSVSAGDIAADATV